MIITTATTDTDTNKTKTNRTTDSCDKLTQTDELKMGQENKKIKNTYIFRVAPLILGSNPPHSAARGIQSTFTQRTH